MKKLSKRFIEAMENAVDQLAVGLDEDQKKKNVAIAIRQFEIAANKGWENSKCGLYIEPLEKTGDIHPKGYLMSIPAVVKRSAVVPPSKNSKRLMNREGNSNPTL